MVRPAERNLYRMRSQMFRRLCLTTVAAVLLWTGCNRDQISPSSPPTSSHQGHIAAGATCVRDGDCRSGFCDRGTCADSATIGDWNYGYDKCEPGPPEPPFDG